MICDCEISLWRARVTVCTHVSICSSGNTSLVSHPNGKVMDVTTWLIVSLYTSANYVLHTNCKLCTYDTITNGEVLASNNR